MNDVCFSNSSEEEYFDIFSDSKTRITFGIVNFVTLLLGNILSGLVIAYEKYFRDDRSKTLLNRLVSMEMFFIVMVNTVHTADNVYLAIFPETVGSTGFCLTFAFMQQASLFCLAFVMHEITLLRYLHICKFYSIGILNEDFIFAFLAIGNVLIGLFLTLAIHVGNGYWSVRYGLCVNKHPQCVLRPRAFVGKPFHLFVVVTVIGLGIQAYARYKIYKARRRWLESQEKLIASLGIQAFIMAMMLLFVAFPFSLGETKFMYGNVDTIKTQPYRTLLQIDVSCSALLSVIVPATILIMTRKWHKN